MSILVLASPLPSEPYAEAIRRIAPELTVWTNREYCNPDTVEAILAWRLKEGMLDAYPNLRLLGSTAAGVEKLLAVSDLSPDLPVVRTVDPAQQTEIAQYAVAAALWFARDFAVYQHQQHQRQWIRHPVRSPLRCRVGILGLGGVGQAIARAFLPLGYAVSGWSRTKKTIAGIETYAGSDALAAFLAKTDILICVLPLTQETEGILNRKTLGSLPQGAFVINLARGGHLVERDLLQLLDSGHLAGAALDVFEREPLPVDSPIWGHGRIVATPHIAAQSAEEVVAQQFVDNLRRLRAGLPLQNQVDRSAGY